MKYRILYNFKYKNYYEIKLKLFIYSLKDIKYKMIGKPIYDSYIPGIGYINTTDYELLRKSNLYFLQYKMIAYESLNYKEMQQQNKDFCEELVKKVFHPERIQRICDVYNMDMTEYLDLV